MAPGIVGPDDGMMVAAGNEKADVERGGLRALFQAILDDREIAARNHEQRLAEGCARAAKGPRRDRRMMEPEKIFEATGEGDVLVIEIGGELGLLVSNDQRFLDLRLEGHPFAWWTGRSDEHCVIPSRIRAADRRRGIAAEAVRADPLTRQQLREGGLRRRARQRRK